MNVMVGRCDIVSLNAFVRGEYGYHPPDCDRWMYTIRIAVGSDTWGDVLDKVCRKVNDGRQAWRFKGRQACMDFSDVPLPLDNIVSQDDIHNDTSIVVHGTWHASGAKRPAPSSPSL